MLFWFLLCVASVWLYFNYVSLINKRERLLDSFQRVDIELKKRYALIFDLINLSSKYAENEQNLVNYINKLREEVIDLGLNPDFINRRIALDKELENKTEQFLSVIKANSSASSDFDIESAIKSYDELNNFINSAKQEYNTLAQVYRKAIDVFPTSFIARLMIMKSFDYMK